MLEDCRTVLDLGCGAWFPISFLDFEYSVGVDSCELTIARAKDRGTHDEFYLYNVQEITDRFSEK